MAYLLVSATSIYYMYMYILAIFPQRSCGYEEYISAQHAAFMGYRDETITKWDAKLRIASGKLSNKVHILLTTLELRNRFFLFFQAFVQVDRSTLAQIKHVRHLIMSGDIIMTSCCLQIGASGQKSSGETDAVEEVSVSRTRQGGRR